MPTINLGIAGYGIRSRVLAAACEAVPELRIAAVAERRTESRKLAAADHPEAALFENYEEMLDSGLIDAVLIETPPDTHAPFATAALERDIHVMCDVPAIHSLSEAGILWEAANARAAVYCFGATTNFWAFVDTALDMKRQGLLGDPVHCEAEYVADLGDLVNVTPWRKHYEPIRYCTHSLGPLLKWIEQDLTAVSCFSTGSRTNEDPDEHDAMTALFRTAGNTTVKVLISFVNCHPVPYHRYSYLGTRGYFERTQPMADGQPQMLFSTRALYGMHQLTPVAVRESRPELAGAPGVGEHGGADYVMLRNFADAIAGEAAPAAGIREALAMSIPGLVALDSANDGGKLKEINYPW